VNRPILIIGGPTGSGKNQLALEIARRFSGEIVNADSRQVYRELAIGTNQPSGEARIVVPHHLYGFLDTTSSFSAADYERFAVPIIAGILHRQRLPVIVGGTGFYIKALLKGVWNVPPKDPVLRKRLRSIIEKRGKSYLHRILRRLDPESAEQIPVNDSYRVCRALEIYLQTGKRKSTLHVNPTEQYSAAKFFLDQERGLLKETIRKRVNEMFEKGWVEEVRSLLQRYPDFKEMPAGSSLGYPEIILYLREQTSLEACKDAIFLKTMKYAKRQVTWFRNQDQFIRLNSQEGLYKNVESVLQLKGEIVEYFSIDGTE
jgi:tRNA dimethylallyltransferase